MGHGRATLDRGGPLEPGHARRPTRLVPPLRHQVRHAAGKEDHELTAIDPWFLENLYQIVEMEDRLRVIGGLRRCDDATLRRAEAIWLFGSAVGHDLDARRRWMSARIASTAGSWPPSKQ